jgi:hypothetical protein
LRPMKSTGLAALTQYLVGIRLGSFKSHDLHQRRRLRAVVVVLGAPS